MKLKYVVDIYNTLYSIANFSVLFSVFVSSQKLKSLKRRCKKLTPVYWGLVSLPRQIESMLEKETSSTECEVARIARPDLLKQNIWTIKFKTIWRQ